MPQTVKPQSKPQPQANKKPQPNVKPVANTSKAIVRSDREAPPERNSKENTAMKVFSVVEEARQRLLMGQTPEYAKKERVGGGGKMYTYVPHGYVTDQLNKVFGWDWDWELVPIGANGDMVKQVDTVPASANKNVVLRPVHNLTVMGKLTVRVRDNKGKHTTTIVKSGVGSQIWNEANEYGDAVKGASSDALKVAASKLGIALDLYWNDAAELDEFAKKQDAAEEMLEINSMPNTMADLLARCMSDLKIDGVAVATKLGKPLTDLFSYTPDQIVDAWKTLSGEGK